MTSHLYQEWILQWNCKLQVKKQKVLLLQDNFSGHIVPEGLKNIWVENLSRTWLRIFTQMTKVSSDVLKHTTRPASFNEQSAITMKVSHQPTSMT